MRSHGGGASGGAPSDALAIGSHLVVHSPTLVTAESGQKDPSPSLVAETERTTRQAVFVVNVSTAWMGARSPLIRWAIAP
jgi:hypothetical protein